MTSQPLILHRSRKVNLYTLKRLLHTDVSNVGTLIRRNQNGNLYTANKECYLQTFRKILCPRKHYIEMTQVLTELKMVTCATYKVSVTDV